jgi:DNA-binding cell septation regulator SpoVG
MLIRVNSIGPSPKLKALAQAAVEIELHNGTDIDVIKMSGLSVARQANSVDEILFVSFPAYKQADGRWLHLLSASTRLRRKIETAVLDAYDAWCQASSSHCPDANSGSASAPSSAGGAR